MSWALLISSILAVSSSNWIIIWIGLEINTVCMCFLISKNIENNEEPNSPIILYFCVQVISSALILLFLSQEWINSTIIIILSVIINIGSWPTHSWYLSLISNLEINNYCILVIITWQNVAPIFLVFNLSLNWEHCMWLILIAIATISVPLTNLKTENSINSFLALSSLNNNGWLLIGSLCSSNLVSTFLMLYSTSITFFIVTVNNLNNNISNNFLNSNSTLIITSNISGVPPLTIFWANSSILNTLMTQNLLFIPCLFIILSACYILYFYISITLSEVSLNPNNNSFPTKNNPLIGVLSVVSLSSSAFLINLD